MTFTIESIGNRTSSTDTVTYIIDRLTSEKPILRKGVYLSEYGKN